MTLRQRFFSALPAPGGGLESRAGCCGISVVRGVFNPVVFACSGGVKAEEIQRTKNMSQNATRMPSAKSKLRDSTDERPSFLYRSTTSVNQLGTVNLNCTKTDTN